VDKLTLDHISSDPFPSLSSSQPSSLEELSNLLSLQSDGSGVLAGELGTGGREGEEAVEPVVAVCQTQTALQVMNPEGFKPRSAITRPRRVKE
jgi:hypothetical protein